MKKILYLILTLFVVGLDCRIVLGEVQVGDNQEIVSVLKGGFNTLIFGKNVNVFDRPFNIKQWNSLLAAMGEYVRQNYKNVQAQQGLMPLFERVQEGALELAQRIQSVYKKCFFQPNIISTDLERGESEVMILQTLKDNVFEKEIENSKLLYLLKKQNNSSVLMYHLLDVVQLYAELLSRACDKVIADYFELSKVPEWQKLN